MMEMEEPICILRLQDFLTQKEEWKSGFSGIPFILPVMAATGGMFEQGNDGTFRFSAYRT